MWALRKLHGKFLTPGLLCQPESFLVLSERTDSPQIEMVLSDNTLKQGEEPGYPLKTLPANMISALSVNEMNNIEQRKDSGCCCVCEPKTCVVETITVSFVTH